MRTFSRERVEDEERNSEMENGSFLEKGDDNELRALTEQILASLPASPGADVVGRLYTALFRRLLKIFERRANDRREAEDAIQEAFIKLQNHYDTHKALPDKPLDWLFIAARNWLIDEHRKETRRGNVAIDDQTPSTIDKLVDGRTDAREPLAAVASAEMNEVSKRAYAELDERTRKIVELRRGGKSWEEIAPLVGVSTPDYARKLYEHAIAHVQAALGAHFSSRLTTAEAEIRRNLKTRDSALKAIDLLPPPSDEILRMLLAEKKPEREIARLRKTSVEQVQLDHKRAVEHLSKAFKISENDLIEALRRK